eukprot:m.950073 g.950073  ORF g.950073 m.950073 type:complete len:273 (+) comp23858_c0_seq24:669-1487(+)
MGGGASGTRDNQFRYRPYTVVNEESKVVAKAYGCAQHHRNRRHRILAAGARSEWQSFDEFAVPEGYHADEAYVTATSLPPLNAQSLASCSADACGSIAEGLDTSAEPQDALRALRNAPRTPRGKRPVATKNSSTTFKRPRRPTSAQQSSKTSSVVEAAGTRTGHTTRVEPKPDTQTGIKKPRSSSTANSRNQLAPRKIPARKLQTVTALLGPATANAETGTPARTLANSQEYADDATVTVNCELCRRDIPFDLLLMHLSLEHGANVARLQRT